MQPSFIRGVLRDRKPFTVHEDHVWEWSLHVDVAWGGSLRILDRNPRLTDDFEPSPGTFYTFVLTPLHYDRSHYLSSAQAPPEVGRFGEAAWWERPLWWAGIVRSLEWFPPAHLDALASHLQPSHPWSILETPAGDILWEPDSDLHLGDVVQWDEIRWFEPLAILPA